MFFIVTRFNIDGTGKENHSQQRYDDETAALKRFYSIIASDIDNDNYKYELVQVVRSSDGLAVRNQVFERTEADE